MKKSAQTRISLKLKEDFFLVKPYPRQALNRYESGPKPLRRRNSELDGISGLCIRKGNISCYIFIITTLRAHAQRGRISWFDIEFVTVAVITAAAATAVA
jgi:hypothetical protein